MPSLMVLGLRNSYSLQIGDYIHGAHCSFWFLHLAGYIWQKPEWDSSPASVSSPDARSTDEILWMQSSSAAGLSATSAMGLWT